MLHDRVHFNGPYPGALVVTFDRAGRPRGKLLEFTFGENIIRYYQNGETQRQIFDEIINPEYRVS